MDGPAGARGYVPGWDDVPPPTDDDEPVPDDSAPPESAPSPPRPAPTGPAQRGRRLHVVPDPSAAPAPEDDEPSRDDADAEDSGLVGAALVAARLGGRVVEP